MQCAGDVRENGDIVENKEVITNINPREDQLYIKNCVTLPPKPSMCNFQMKSCLKVTVHKNTEKKES